MAESLGQQPHIFLDSILKQGNLFCPNPMLYFLPQVLSNLFVLQVSLSSYAYTLDGFAEVQCFRAFFLSQTIMSPFP